MSCGKQTRVQAARWLESDLCGWCIAGLHVVLCTLSLLHGDRRLGYPALALLRHVICVAQYERVACSKAGSEDRSHMFFWIPACLLRYAASRYNVEYTMDTAQLNLPAQGSTCQTLCDSQRKQQNAAQHSPVRTAQDSAACQAVGNAVRTF
jgi:hypothetical protein